jgi:D-alanyl-D-alanine carboxypeptidase/D-alanyl-D-alanine-endopeptidase (penicillin-binding protein 4)
MIRRLVLVFLAAVAFARGADAPSNFKRIAVGKAVLSLPADWRAPGPEIPVWLHLHGAPATVEAQFATLGVPGVLVNVTLPGLSKIYADYFAGPEALADLLRDVTAALRTESSAQPWRLGRLTVSSFSAGFGGVRAMLHQPAAFDRIGALVMADSIYCGYAGDVAAKQLDEELMAGFLRFARLAAEGKKRLVVSHSRQVPEGYASTTETADYLLAKLGGERTGEIEEWPGGLRLLSTCSLGRCEILGFDGDGPADHMRHLQSIGQLLERAIERPAAQAVPTLEDLRRQIDAHVTQPRFAPALWGVKVASLETGRTLYEHHADRLLSPASNSKLYTGALALDTLGPDYRIVTPVFATNKPDAAGIVRGDVIVSGRGDPSWHTLRRRDDFWQNFTPFVQSLQQAGVRRITGDLIADATWFHALPNGAGWTADDLNDYYGAEISAITLEDNYVDVRIAPGAKAGDPCAASILQPHSGLTLDNRMTTVAAGAPRVVSLKRVFDENVVHLFGQLPLGGKDELTEATVPRPAAWFARALKEALGRSGIVVEGLARGVRWPERSPVTSEHLKLCELMSVPMADLVTAFMKPSQNLETDLIFGHIGESRRTEVTPEWHDSDRLALTALAEFLRAQGVPESDVRFEEGSGLSRNNLTTANATVALLTAMSSHRAAKEFLESLPVAGVDGTLRRRFKGTPAEGNLRAKTGSLRYARSLSGYLTTAAGERLVLSIMLNRQPASASGRSVADELDDVVLMLARFTGRSAAE